MKIMKQSIRAKTEKSDNKRGINLYVLELQEGKYYVGITNQPVRRINKHMKGISASDKPSIISGKLNSLILYSNIKLFSIIQYNYEIRN